MIHAVAHPAITLVIFATLILTGMSEGLKCWNCIGDLCDQNPSKVESATNKQCMERQSCVKVMYRVRDSKDSNRIYESTVRSCSSGECFERDDFQNCTIDMLENPGCMQKFCCNDKDNCNTASMPGLHTLPYRLLHLIPTFITSASLLNIYTADGYT